MRRHGRSFPRISLLAGELTIAGLSRSCGSSFNRANEAVAALGHSLQKVRMLRVILQHRANVPDGEVQTLFIIYECLRSPDLLGQVPPSDHLSAPAGLPGPPIPLRAEAGALRKSRRDAVLPVLRSSWKLPKRTRVEEPDGVAMRLPQAGPEHPCRDYTGNIRANLYASAG